MIGAASCELQVIDVEQNLEFTLRVGANCWVAVRHWGDYILRSECGGEEEAHGDLSRAVQYWKMGKKVLWRDGEESKIFLKEVGT